MKKIVINNFLDLEREYLRKNTPYLIEEELLHSMSKEELKSLIEAVKEEYLKEKLPYEHQLGRKRLREGYEELNKISKYFIEVFEYYFAGGEEIELTKKFLERLTRFYRVNYEMDQSIRKHIDIQSIPIREILGMYIHVPDNLRRNIRCPFPDHNDKSASFKVYEDTNSFYCFGCGTGGGVVEFVSKFEQINKKEAFIKIVKLYS